MIVKLVWTTGLVDSTREHFHTAHPACWSRERRQLLADSVLRGYDIPKIYLRPIGDGNYAVLDGSERLQALWAFYDGQLTLPADAAPVTPVGGEEAVAVAGLGFAGLPDSLRNQFDCYEMDIAVLDSVDDAAAAEMMRRIQG